MLTKHSLDKLITRNYNYYKAQLIAKRHYNSITLALDILSDPLRCTEFYTCRWGASVQSEVFVAIQHVFTSIYQALQ